MSIKTLQKVEVLLLVPFMLHSIVRTMEPQAVHYRMDFGGLSELEQVVAREVRG